MRTALLLLVLAAAAACSKKHNDPPSGGLTGTWALTRSFDPAVAYPWFYPPDTAKPIDFSMAFLPNGNYLQRWDGVPYDSGAYTYTGDTLSFTSLISQGTWKAPSKIKGDRQYSLA